MKTTIEGIRLIKESEGFRTHAYLDAVGIPTIGYGFTKNVKLGQIITLEQAEKRLILELEEYENAVKNAVDYPINPNQFSSLVSLSYNIGIDAFNQSTLVRLLNAGKVTEASQQFDRWVKADGRVLPGLVIRRNREEALFNKPYKDIDSDSIRITHPTFYKLTTYSSTHPSNEGKVSASVGTVLPFLAFKEEDNHYKITFGSYDNNIKKDLKIANRNTWYLFKDHVEFIQEQDMETPIKKPRRLVDRFVDYCEAKGFPLSKSDYNIVGISGIYPMTRGEVFGYDGSTSLTVNRTPDRWNDSIGIVAFVDSEFRFLCLFRSTVEPGRYYTVNPLNKNGCAVLDWGYHKDLWTFGKHKGYEALVQAGTARLIRDRNKDYLRNDRITFESGNGVNLHTANNPTDSIQKWSAGCNVIKLRKEFEEFLDIIKQSPQYRSNRNCRFDYRLLSYDWL